MRKVLLLLTFFFLFSCAGRQQDTRELIDFIPDSAGVVLKLNNPDLFFSNLKNNGLINSNENHPLQRALKEQFSFLNHFSHKNPTIVAFSGTDGKDISYSFISKGIPEIEQLDSIKNRKVETLTHDGIEIVKYTLEESVTYTSSRDSIFIISDSREVLLQSLEFNKKNLHHEDFQRSLKAVSEKSPSIFINHEYGAALFGQLFPNASNELKTGEEFLKEFSNWTSLDADFSQTSIKLNGISTATDTLPKLLNVFEEVPPAELELARIVPTGTQGFQTVGFGDFPRLAQNLRRFREQDTISEGSREYELLASSSEAGNLQFEKSAVFAIRPNDIVGASHAYAADREETEEFRGITIFKAEGSDGFRKLLTPLLIPENLQYFLTLDQFILFSENLDLLKEVVMQFQNQSTLEGSEAYRAALKSLSTKASMLQVVNNEQTRSSLAEMVANDQQTATADLQVEDYPITALQFIYQNDYSHVHIVLEKTNGVTKKEGVRQSSSVQLNADIATAPVFFRNHRSKGLDIAVQDQNNSLYLLSEKGEIFWKKKLDTRILGKIQEVDLYKNGRIQLAFATQNKLHVLDRNGNEVKPFPLEFRDEITQPLALFDYSNNRDYRFVITQGRELFMFNSKGQRVKGFTFSKAADEIVHPPKHIRLGNKDYILVADASGKLYILNRRGNTRIPVRETFSFSGNEWFEYNNQFVSTNSGGQLLKIDQSGNIRREDLQLSEGHRMDVTSKTLASLSENELSIKGKKVTLDYGLYTAPEIFYINNKLYISVTDLQAQRVYLFDSNAELLPDFPVYGNSTIDLGNADGDGGLEFTVQGDGNRVLLYQMPR